MDGFVGKPPNPARKAPDLTMSGVEHVKPFTSGARTVHSVLPHFLTWPSPLHQLVAGFVAKRTNPVHEMHSLTMPSFEHTKSFTFGARTVYSILHSSLTWLPRLHRLIVDFVAKLTNRR